MFKKGQVKPRKISLVIAIILGIILVITGLTVTINIPQAELLGVICTSIGALITLSNVYNFFSKKEVSFCNISIETNNTNDYHQEDFESKLRKLDSLRHDGIITQKEYELKRKEIMKETW